MTEGGLDVNTRREMDGRKRGRKEIYEYDREMDDEAEEKKGETNELEKEGGGGWTQSKT